ncbi:MAG: DivIVA domain-containing protein [Solirubrobacteraceae bacterium]
MSYFERPPDAGEQPTGHDVEPAISDASAPYWASGPFAEPEPEAWPGDQPRARDEADDDVRPRVGARLTHLRDRVRGALAGLELGQVTRPTVPAADPEETQAFDVLDDVPSPEPDGAPSRFAVAPLGYSRSAVDERIAALERELSELRATRPDEEPAISITEEIERLGEQTASILVVAHDKAHETTRLAHERAEQCVTDAAENATAITEQAKHRLEALDVETDVVWQERARLLADARAVAQELTAMVERAEQRFPEEPRTADVEAQTIAVDLGVPGAPTADSR